MSVNPATIANLGSILALIDATRAAFTDAMIEERESSDVLHEAGQAERRRFLTSIFGNDDDEIATTAAVARAKRRHRVALQRFHAARDAYESAVAAFHDEVADLTTPI